MVPYLVCGEVREGRAAGLFFYRPIEEARGQVTAIEFARFAAMLVIFGAIWKLVMVNLPDGPVRRGMAFVNN